MMKFEKCTCLIGFGSALARRFFGLGLSPSSLAFASSLAEAFGASGSSTS